MAFFGTPGHERWHPNPAFYYLPGGGPVLDMGPYYITDLVNLLGPVRRVAAITSRLRSERLVTSEPLKGTKIPVEVATHASGTLEFVNGAVVTVVLSFDIPRYRHSPIEIYGATGSLGVPDPNFFDGEIMMATRHGGLAPGADRTRPRRAQPAHHGGCRHGPRHPLRAAAPGERRPRLPRPRGDGGLPASSDTRHAHRNDDAARSGRR